MCQIDKAATMKLSSQDKKDLDKYTKFLAYKTSQIIVQSRLGERISTKCIPTKPQDGVGSDFVFNLNVSDYPDVLAAVRKALNGEVISPCTPLSIEISLRTSEGDVMILEYWCLNLLPEEYDSTVKVNYTVYNRMGILLKSLVSVTRVTPAYKLSRRQGPESYVICYRVFTEHPQLLGLGDGHKQVRIGQICTPIGTLQLSVAYRTKMTISPTQAGKNNSIMVKSDHFNANANPRKHKNNDDINDLTKPMRPGPFADPKPKQEVQSELPDVTRLLSMGKYKKRSVFAKSEIEADISTTTTIEDGEGKKKDSPTSSLLSTASTLKSVDNEYWMKELSAPFATLGPMGELMQFYRQCRRSPPLQSLQKTLTVDEVSKMLAVFQGQVLEYDELVQSFCETPDSD